MVIEFYLEYLRRVKFKEHFEDIEIIIPCVAQFLKTLKREAMSSQFFANELEPSRLLQRRLVLIPVSGA